MDKIIITVRGRRYNVAGLVKRIIAAAGVVMFAYGLIWYFDWLRDYNGQIQAIISSL